MSLTYNMGIKTKIPRRRHWSIQEGGGKDCHIFTQLKGDTFIVFWRDM